VALTATVEIHRTSSEEQTIALGERLARGLDPGAVVVLSGDLGAGKTTLAKGIAKGLGADPEEVTSPTFTLIHEYGRPPKVYHVDLYRIEDARQAARLGLEELYAGGAVVLVEWGERFPEVLPAERVEIHLERDGDQGRLIRVRKAS